MTIPKLSGFVRVVFIVLLYVKFSLFVYNTLNRSTELGKCPPEYDTAMFGYCSKTRLECRRLKHLKRCSSQTVSYGPKIQCDVSSRFNAPYWYRAPLCTTDYVNVLILVWFVVSVVVGVFFLVISDNMRVSLMTKPQSVVDNKKQEKAAK